MPAETWFKLIPSYGEQALRLVYSQFRDLPKWRALLGGLSYGVQTLEEAAFDVLVSGPLDVASGYDLDVWGRVLGEQRLGLTDEEYRRFLAARALANRSAGDRDSVLDVWRVATGASSVAYFDLLPAAGTLLAVRSSFMRDDNARRVYRLVDSVVPAAVNFECIEAVEGYFGFDEDTSAEGFDVGPFARSLRGLL